jgi:radical SAM protein with 4Fe4S-binding SPASM domain
MAVYPTDATIAVTYRCDARCRMCNIWQLDPQEFLKADDYSKVPSTLRDINISGGEPFLRKEMADIVRIVNDKCSRPRIVISSNGFRTKHIIGTMEELRRVIPNIGIGISLDGIHETHDSIRGVKGAYHNALATLHRLKEREFTNVRVDFTAQSDNLHEMQKVYDLTCSLGFQFTTAVAQNSEIYFSTQSNTEVDAYKLHDALGYIIKKELMSYHPKRWARAYFECGTVVFNREKRRIIGCLAGDDFFYLSPDGIVYPCLTLPLPLGDLKEHTFEEIWESDGAEKIRSQIKGCEKCWMICGTRSSLKKNAFKVAGWIVREKIKSHFKK